FRPGGGGTEFRRHGLGVAGSRPLVSQALLDQHDIALVRAENPGPFTLSGTNTWIVGRDPCWVVDPGPAIDAHVAAIEAEVGVRGGAAGIVLTHDHADHGEAASELAHRLDVRVAATRAARTVRI